MPRGVYDRSAKGAAKAAPAKKAAAKNAPGPKSKKLRPASEVVGLSGSTGIGEAKVGYSNTFEDVTRLNTLKDLVIGLTAAQSTGAKSNKIDLLVSDTLDRIASIAERIEPLHFEKISSISDKTETDGDEAPAQAQPDNVAPVTKSSKVKQVAAPAPQQATFAPVAAAQTPAQASFIPAPPSNAPQA